MEKEIKINVQKMFKDGRIVKLDEKSTETVDVLLSLIHISEPTRPY